MRLRTSLLAALLAAAAVPLRADPPSPAPTKTASDPVLVFYPRRDCRGERIELEVFDRDTKVWKSHPVHDRVPVESCQVEDAGQLWNEIRWRCEEPPDTDPPSIWVIGLDVFDPRVMEQCASSRRQADTGVELRVASPAEGATLRNPTMEVAIEGSVVMNGMPGAEYDVLLALDRSEGTHSAGVELLDPEIEAAKAFVKSLEPRLGAVRIGVVTYPNLPPLPGDGGTGAHREIALGHDPAALHVALDKLHARGASGFSTFLSAFEYGLRELDPAQAHGARPHARKVLVLLSSARGRLPFGPGADQDPGFRARLLAQAQHARERGVALHLVGLAGLAEQTPESVALALKQSAGSLHRVALPALWTPFLDAIPLPELREVVIANRSAGLTPHVASTTPDGRFSLTLPATPGDNRLWLRATLSDGAAAERELEFRFDDSLVRERLLAAEAERIRRIRQQKQLTLRPEEQSPTQ